jgi:hypothetical protein
MKKLNEVVEIDKGKIHIIVELIEYIPNAVVLSKLILPLIKKPIN